MGSKGVITYSDTVSFLTTIVFHIPAAFSLDCLSWKLPLLGLILDFTTSWYTQHFVILVGIEEMVKVWWRREEFFFFVSF